MSASTDVMKLLKVDAETAERVLTEMHQHIRFSECTQRAFNREARLALDVIRYVDKQRNLSPYAQRVQQLEREGLTTSDAQGIADIENLEDWATS